MELICKNLDGRVYGQKKVLKQICCRYASSMGTKEVAATFSGP